MRIPIDLILSEYTPGAGDLEDGETWAWSDEFASLWCLEHSYMSGLVADIVAQGIKEPILLGNDGRLWDGHHRLAVAVALRYGYIEAEITPMKEDDNA